MSARPEIERLLNAVYLRDFRFSYALEELIDFASKTQTFPSDDNKAAGAQSELSCLEIAPTKKADLKLKRNWVARCKFAYFMP